jgi:hypothetical protein
MEVDNQRKYLLISLAHPPQLPTQTALGQLLKRQGNY